MKSCLFCCSLLLTFLLVSSLALASPRVIIEDVTLIDAVNLVRENMTVVLQGDVIESIEESSSKIIDVKIDDTVIVYCTDIEHPDDHLNPNIIDIAQGADVLIKDAQFTDEELPAHKGWGHSIWQQCTAVAKKAQVKQLILYHHSPNNDDDAIFKIEKDAQAIFPNTLAAREGLEILLPA